jgi:hypothetical protein
VTGPVDGEIQGGAHEKRLRLLYRVLTAIHLQPKKGFLNDVVRVLDIAAAAAQEAAELLEKGTDFVHAPMCHERAAGTMCGMDPVGSSTFDGALNGWPRGAGATR